MDSLHKYVPLNKEEVYPIPTHGDALSVERMLDAQKARACEFNPTERVQGLIPVPQEFHHRGLMLQVL